MSAQGGSHYDGPHQKMGLALFILVWFQFAAGVFRPKHPVEAAQSSKLRSLWEKVHPRSGRVLQILGFITAFAGTIVARSMPGVNTSALTAGSVFWVLWVLLLAFGFYKLEQRNKAAAAAAAATVTEGGGGKRWYQLG